MLMGTSSAAAAGMAGGLVFIFGGTGAGLAGYRMKKRTLGLTDFEFKQYDEKVIIVKSAYLSLPLIHKYMGKWNYICEKI